MNNVIDSTEHKPDLKLTAEEIEKECPARLQQIGKEIRQRLAKADKQTELAQNHLIAVEQLLVEAKALCDDGGFKKFLTRPAMFLAYRAECGNDHSADTSSGAAVDIVHFAAVRCDGHGLRRIQKRNAPIGS